MNTHYIGRVEIRKNNTDYFVANGTVYRFVEGSEKATLLPDRPEVKEVGLFLNQWETEDLLGEVTIYETEDKRLWWEY